MVEQFEALVTSSDDDPLQAAQTGADADFDYYRTLISDQSGTGLSAAELPTVNIVNEQDLPQGFAAVDSKPAGPQTSITQLVEDFGVSVGSIQRDGETTLTYLLPMPFGDAQTVAIGNDVDQVWATLSRQRASTEKRLESEYGLQILDDGWKSLNNYVMRAPTLRELVTLEYALTQSGPSALSEDNSAGEGLWGDIVEFFDGDQLLIGYAQADTSVSADAYYSGGNFLFSPQIIFDPGEGVVVSTAIHEMSHNGQYGYWQADHPESARYNEYLSLLGWVRTASGVELIMTDDSPAQYFREFNVDGGFGSGRNCWLRTDSEGHWLDENGQRVDKQDEAQQITNKEMVRRALVKPASNYIDTPREHGAELVTAFRLEAGSRAELLRQNMDTYNLAKELDQREINAEYGVSDDGTPRKIRLETGEIVYNFVVNRQRIADWEREQALVQPQWRQIEAAPEREQGLVQPEWMPLPIPNTTGD